MSDRNGAPELSALVLALDVRADPVVQRLETADDHAAQAQDGSKSARKCPLLDDQPEGLRELRQAHGLGVPQRLEPLLAYPRLADCARVHSPRDVGGVLDDVADCDRFAVIQRQRCAQEPALAARPMAGEQPLGEPLSGVDGVSRSRDPSAWARRCAGCSPRPPRASGT